MGNYCCIYDRSSDEKTEFVVNTYKDPFSGFGTSIKKPEYYLENIHKTFARLKKIGSSVNTKTDLKSKNTDIECKVTVNDDINKTNLMKENILEVELTQIEKDVVLKNVPKKQVQFQYDFMLCMETLDDFITRPQKLNVNIERMKIYQDVCYITILGLKSVGKTFLTNLLTSNTEFGMNFEPTKDMGFKIWPNRPNSFQTNVVIDSSEFDILNINSNKVDTNIYMKQEFYHQFIKKYSSCMIWVMKECTNHDMRMIEYLRQQSNDTFIVVHNFMECDNNAEIEQRVQNDIMEHFKATEAQIVIKGQTIKYYKHENAIHLILKRQDKRVIDQVNHITKIFLENFILLNAKMMSFGKYGPLTHLMEFIEENLMNVLKPDENAEFLGQYTTKFDELTSTLSIEKIPIKADNALDLEHICSISLSPNSSFSDEDEKIENAYVITNSQKTYQLQQTSTELILSFEISNLNIESLNFNITKVLGNNQSYHAYDFMLTGHLLNDPSVFIQEINNSIAKNQFPIEIQDQIKIDKELIIENNVKNMSYDKGILIIKFKFASLIHPKIEEIVEEDWDLLENH